MDNLLAPAKSIRRVVLVFPDGEARTVFQQHSRKRSSKGLKRPERAQRKFVEALQVGNAEYLRRHEKSARKRKDGWVRDLIYNTARANEKAFSKLRRIRLV